MQIVAPWLWGAVALLIGFLGLFMVAGAHDGVFALAGYLLMLFGLLFIFLLIRRGAPRT